MSDTMDFYHIGRSFAKSQTDDLNDEVSLLHMLLFNEDLFTAFDQALDIIDFRDIPWG